MFLMTYVVLKGYLYDPIDCIRPATTMKMVEYTEKTVLFNFDFYILVCFYLYILVLVSFFEWISIS
jgi:hypothetical protein